MEVANRLLEHIEQGTAPWQKPWEAGQILPPINAVTGKPYRGVNYQNLMTLSPDPSDPRWCTYKQAREQGWQVREGSSGIPIEVWKEYEHKRTAEEIETIRKERQAAGKSIGDIPEKEKRLGVRYYSVFHASQIDGIPPMERPERSHELEGRPDPRLDGLSEAMGIAVRRGGSKAFYRPGEDFVQMPRIEDFHTATGHDTTLLHELSHATGHPQRLNREFGKAFGDQKYAIEELRAEMSAAMTAAALGIGFDPAAQTVEEGRETGNSAAYLASWLGTLPEKERKQILIQAIKDAQAISDFLIERTPALQVEPGRAPEPAPGADPSPEIPAAQSLVTQVPDDVRHFLGVRQAAVTDDLLRGEEKAFFSDKMREMQEIIRQMPATYETDGLPDSERPVSLRYFGPNGAQWFIIEKDRGDPENEGPGFPDQTQTFGLADLGMGYPELGYINIPEITRAGAELDYHFTPATLLEIKREHYPELVREGPTVSRGDYVRYKDEIVYKGAEIEAVVLDPAQAGEVTRLRRIYRWPEGTPGMDGADHIMPTVLPEHLLEHIPGAVQPGLDLDAIDPQTDAYKRTMGMDDARGRAVDAVLAAVDAARGRSERSAALQAAAAPEPALDPDLVAFLEERNQIRQGEHPNFAGLSDPVANAGDFVTRHAERNPAIARKWAETIRENLSAYSDAVGLSPDSLSAIASQMESGARRMERPQIGDLVRFEPHDPGVTAEPFAGRVVAALDTNTGDMRYHLRAETGPDQGVEARVYGRDGTFRSVDLEEAVGFDRARDSEMESASRTAWVLEKSNAALTLGVEQMEQMRRQVDDPHFDKALESAHSALALPSEPRFIWERAEALNDVIVEMEQAKSLFEDNDGQIQEAIDSGTQVMSVYESIRLDTPEVAQKEQAVREYREFYDQMPERADKLMAEIRERAASLAPADFRGFSEMAQDFKKGVDDVFGIIREGENRGASAPDLRLAQALSRESIADLPVVKNARKQSRLAGDRFHDLDTELREGFRKRLREHGKELLQSGTLQEPREIVQAVYWKHGIEAGPDSPMVDKLIAAVQERDLKTLTNWIGHNSLNPGSEEAFSRLTGVKLGNTQKERVAQLQEWAGPERVEALRKEREDAEKSRADEAPRKAVRQTFDALTAINVRLSEKSVETMDGQEWIEAKVAEGYTTVGTHKKGAITLRHLENPENRQTVWLKDSRFQSYCKAIQALEPSGDVAKAMETAKIPLAEKPKEIEPVRDPAPAQKQEAVDPFEAKRRAVVQAMEADGWKILPGEPEGGDRLKKSYLVRKDPAKGGDYFRGKSEFKTSAVAHVRTNGIRVEFGDNPYFVTDPTAITVGRTAPAPEAIAERMDTQTKAKIAKAFEHLGVTAVVDSGTKSAPEKPEPSRDPAAALHDLARALDALNGHTLPVTQKDGTQKTVAARDYLEAGLSRGMTATEDLGSAVRWYSPEHGTRFSRTITDAKLTAALKQAAAVDRNVGNAIHAAQRSKANELDFE